MRTQRTVWAVGLGLIALGVAVFPAVGAFSPQVLAPGASQQVSSDPAQALQNGLKSRDRAKAISDEKGKREKEAESLLDDGASKGSASGSLATKVYSAGEIVSAFNKDAVGAKETLAGAWVKVEGIVAQVNDSGNRLIVSMLPRNPKPDSPVFMCRFPDKTQAFELGKPTTIEGRFLYRLKDDSGQVAYVVDVASLDSAGQAPAQEEPKKKFDEGFAGWRYIGAVENEQGATGVFVRGDETKYAQKDDKIEPGLRVVDVEAGSATLEFEGEKSVVIPW